MASVKGNPEIYIARLDRLPGWGLSYIIFWALGFSFFITLYDVINVGFALPYIPFITSSSEASLVASLGLFGYVVGAPIFSFLSDRIGRKPAMVFTSFLIAIGSFGDAFSVNFPMLSLFRFITGMAIGADLVLVMTYIAEMSPAKKRGIYSNIAFIAGYAGLGIGPYIAAEVVTTIPNIGWRIVFMIGGILAVGALLIRAYAPESLRFLAFHGKLEEAEKLISIMEEISIKRYKIDKLPDPIIMNYKPPKENPLKILLKPIYLKRLIVLFFLSFWFYFIDYPFLVLTPTWLKANLGYSSSQLSYAIFLFGLSGLGVILGSIILRFFIDRYDRRKLAIIDALFYMIGAIIMSIGAVGHNFTTFFIGSFIAETIGVGWFNVYYLLDVDNFPTIARATGYSLTDGIGHLGGALGLLALLPLANSLGNISVWGILWIPALIMGGLTLIFTPKTTGFRLEEVNENKI
ncbi:MFS transporter [Acidianus ambivalens]|uniref:MFS transporter n=1 Tax=Acidianus ambivalens TaxID=2283 RepID=A0A650CWI1_ACIAM|nr:MFS transporter [Acidianus ambivalens]MQL54316.1 MFS transporter [Acidianus ambivalens]QGR22143.1 MFS transporter [Acidianus ambivalens]